MHKTLVFKLKPTKAQQGSLARYLEVTREVYNAALEQRRTAYALGHRVSRFQQSAEMKELRAAGILDGVHSHAITEVLHRLEIAYGRFFNGAGFPRFKSGRHWRSIGFHQWGNGCYIKDGRLRVSKVGDIKLRQHRDLEGTPKACTLVRKADGWYAHILCDTGVAPLLRGGDRTTGIDLGLEAFATLSDGSRVANPRPARAAHAKLVREQRDLQRKQRGSARRTKQRQRVALAHLKVQRARRDFHHKLARDLVSRFDRIAVEDLAVAAMRSKGGAYKRGLNRSMADAAWGGFLAILAQKCEQEGVELVAVNPAYTSQTCSGCGAIEKKHLSERWHDCECGASLHRDHNAAINIEHRAWAVPVVEEA